MTDRASAVEIVQEQLDAYNKRDLGAYCDLFARDATISMLGNKRILAEGSEDIRSYYQARFFRSPDLRCNVVGRIVLGPWVIDHEHVIGIGPTIVEVVVVYEVREGLIRSVQFLSGSDDIATLGSHGRNADEPE